MFHIKLNASSTWLSNSNTEYNNIMTPMPAISPPLAFSSIDDAKEIR